MVTLIKYGALSGGEKYNVNVLSIDGLSTDTKPTVTYIEYGSDGREIGRMGIPNGSLYTEIDTGDTYMYDAENKVWYKVSKNYVTLDENGFIPLENLPPEIYERMYGVADDDARFDLTTDEVQNGDVVFVNDTQIMYLVVDDTKLDSEDGYQEFAAGIAAKAIADEDGRNIKNTYLTEEEYNAGKTVPKGTTVTFRGQTYTVADNAEIFNGYSYNTATGRNSHAEGESTAATGSQAHAEGAGTWASGSQAHAEGAGATASEMAAHAEGGSTTASGICSHAEGGGTTASESNSHAEGSNTTASGICSHAEGAGTTASESNSHAEGGGTTASGICSHAEGGGTTASEKNSHAEGDGTKATNTSAHAEGNGTTASGTNSHAEGAWSTASGNNSHAEGSGTGASGNSSHAEGAGSSARGTNSHAEGGGTTASGDNSHAEGGGTIASGSRSHAEGESTIASSNYQHVEGKWNIGDANSKFAHIIGNGTANNARSNAFAIDWDGKIYTHNSATGFDINGNYLEMPNGIRLYISATAPTGDIPDGSVGVGW